MVSEVSIIFKCGCAMLLLGSVWVMLFEDDISPKQVVACVTTYLVGFVGSLLNLTWLQHLSLGTTMNETFDRVLETATVIADSPWVRLGTLAVGALWATVLVCRLLVRAGKSVGQVYGWLTKATPPNSFAQAVLDRLNAPNWEYDTAHGRLIHKVEGATDLVISDNGDLYLGQQLRADQFGSVKVFWQCMRIVSQKLSGAISTELLAKVLPKPKSIADIDKDYRDMIKNHNLLTETTTANPENPLTKLLREGKL